MHVNILLWMKSYEIKFLKVVLTYPDSAIESRITPACVCLNLRNLHMIDSSHGIFDLQRIQHKFVEESQYENKNPVSMRGMCIEFVPKAKYKYEVYSAVKLSGFSSFDKDFASCLLTCL